MNFEPIDSRCNVQRVTVLVGVDTVSELWLRESLSLSTSVLHTDARTHLYTVPITNPDTHTYAQANKLTEKTRVAQE